jgi:hypothetical protein
MCCRLSYRLDKETVDTLFRHDTSVFKRFFVPSELQPRAHTCNLSHMLCVQEIAGGERYLCVNRDVEVCLMCLNIIVLPEYICSSSSDFALILLLV